MKLSRIKQLSETRNGGLRKLAADIEMSEPNIHRCININDMKASDLERVAHIFGVPISYFFDEIADAIPTSRQYGYNQTKHINSAKLTKIIENSNLTKKEIADKCCISCQTLYNILSGADAKLSTIEKITEVLGITIADLYNNYSPTSLSRQNSSIYELQAKIDSMAELINHMKEELITSRRQLEINHNYITLLEKQLANFDNSTGVTTINSKQNNETN